MDGGGEPSSGGSQVSLEAGVCLFVFHSFYVLFCFVLLFCFSTPSK